MASATTVPTPALATPAPLPPTGRLVGIGLIIFLANAALLVLQLVASRLLAPFIGSSLETWTSIIGVFLVGIALGNAYGGRIADRHPSPRTLAILLAAGAIAALWMVVFPLVLSSSSAYKSLPLGPRIPLLALVLCLPAGFVLSLLTPLAIKLGLPDVTRTGRVAGIVFALSTLGCLIGNYVTGFVLIPAFTINTLVFFAAGALAVLACGTFVFLIAPQSPEQSTPTSGLDDIPSSSNPHAFPDIRLAYTIVFLASFGGMTLELTASRVLAQYLGVSLFTWTGIIGVMLAGTALGNFTGGLFADRASQPGGMRQPLAWLIAIVTFALVFGLIDKVLPWACTSLGAPLGMAGTGLAMVAAILALVAAYGL
jgi:MFS family permease